MRNIRGVRGRGEGGVYRGWSRTRAIERDGGGDGGDREVYRGGVIGR